VKCDDACASKALDAYTIDQELVLIFRSSIPQRMDMLMVSFKPLHQTRAKLNVAGCKDEIRGEIQKSLYPQQPLFVRLVKGSSIILDEKHSFYRESSIL
jgi:hypothetical protein